MKHLLVIGFIALMGLVVTGCGDLSTSITAPAGPGLVQPEAPIQPAIIVWGDDIPVKPVQPANIVWGG